VSGTAVGTRNGNLSIVGVELNGSGGIDIVFFIQVKLIVLSKSVAGQATGE